MGRALTAGSHSLSRDGTRPLFRRAVAGDVYVTLNPQDPDELRVDCGFPLPGWRPRPPRVPSRPDFPGTAVLYQERWFEIVRMEQATAGARVLYHLRPWDETHAIRAPQELSRAAAERATATHRQELRNKRQGSLAGLLIVLVGLLPADVQKRMELRYGINPAIGSLLSAAFLAALSMASLLLVFAMRKGMVMGVLAGYVRFAESILPVFLYLLLESLLRVNCALNSEPLGSFLVAGPYNLIRLVAEGARREGPRLPPAARAIRHGLEDQWLRATDQVSAATVGEDGKHRLEIRSRLPKEHWRAHIHGIDWDGRRYTLEDRRQDPKSDHPHIFLLEEASDEVLFRDIHAYDPCEVQEVYRAQRRLTLGSRIKAFGLLWGYTHPQLQEALADIYGYEPWRNTRGSIRFSLVFALLMLGTAAYRIQSETAVPGDAIMVVFFFVLGWEGLVRWSRLRQGELSESLLGPVFAPFVRPTLRWRAAPHWRYPDDG